MTPDESPGTARFLIASDRVPPRVPPCIDDFEMPRSAPDLSMHSCSIRSSSSACCSGYVCASGARSIWSRNWRPCVERARHLSTCSSTQAARAVPSSSRLDSSRHSRSKRRERSASSSGESLSDGLSSCLSECLSKCLSACSTRALHLVISLDNGKTREDLDLRESTWSYQYYAPKFQLLHQYGALSRTS